MQQNNTNKQEITVKHNEKKQTTSCLYTIHVYTIYIMFLQIIVTTIM